MAMRDARASMTDVAQWRALLSAFLRPVYLEDPIFEQTVVLYARSRGGAITGQL